MLDIVRAGLSIASDGHGSGLVVGHDTEAEKEMRSAGRYSRTGRPAASGTHVRAQGVLLLRDSVIQSYLCRCYFMESNA